MSPQEESSDDDNNTSSSQHRNISEAFLNDLNIEDSKPKRQLPYHPNITIDFATVSQEMLGLFNLYNEEDEENDDHNKDNIHTKKEKKEKVALPSQASEEVAASSLSSQNATQSMAAKQPEEPTSSSKKKKKSKPKPQEHTQTRLMKKHPPSNSFLENFNPEGQLSSLQGMQYALVDASEQISTTLKTLVLKAHSSARHLSLLDERAQIHSNLNRNSMSFKKNRSDIEHDQNLDALHFVRPYNVFASTNSYTTNLERKVQTGQAGLLVNLVPEVNIVLAYDYNKKEYKEYKGLQLNSNVGSIKSKTTTDGLAAIVTLNPDKKGLTGNMVGLYSWGKVKNTRNVIQGEKEVITTGSPDITLSGGLVQIGYNLSTIKSLIFTPYIEYLASG